MGCCCNSILADYKVDEFKLFALGSLGETDSRLFSSCTSSICSAFEAMEVYLLEALPVELVRSVWVNWLTLIDVAHADTALCKHKVRTTFLDGVYGASCVYDYSDYFDTNKSKRSIMFTSSTFLEWILKRKVKLASLSMYNAVYADLLGSCPDLLFEAIRHTGLHLRSIQVGGVSGPLCALLAECCPALQTVYCLNTINRLRWYPSLLRAAPHLQHLVIEPDSSRATVREIALHGAHIQSLTIRPAWDTDWSNLLSSLPSLTTLDLTSVDISMNFVEQLAQYHPNLLSLRLDRGGVENDVLLRLTERCTQLQRLSVGDTLRSGTMQTILARCRGLTALHLSARSARAEGVMVTVARELPTLRELVIGRDGIYWAFTELPALLPCWPLLEHLEMTLSWASDKVLEALGRNCKHLRALVLRGGTSAHVSSKGIIALAEGCIHLKQFVCDTKFISVEAVQAIAAHCRYIELVQVSSSPVISQVQAFKRFLVA